MNTELIGAQAWYRIYGSLLSGRRRSRLNREKQALDLLLDIFARIARRQAGQAAEYSRRLPFCVATNW